MIQQQVVNAVPRSRILSPLRSSRRRLTGLIIFLALIPLLFWLETKWKRASGIRRLQAAINAAQTDLASWSWAELMKPAKGEERIENVSRHVLEWLEQRGLATPSWHDWDVNNLRPDWLIALDQYRFAHYPYLWTKWGSFRVQDFQPNHRLPVDLAAAWKCVFSYPEAKLTLNQLRQWIDQHPGRYPHSPTNAHELDAKIIFAAQLLAAEALWRSESEPSDEAIKNIRTILFLAQCVGDDSEIDTQLERMWLGKVAVRTLQRTLAQSAQTSIKELLALREDLLKEASQPLFLIIARSLRAETYHDLALLQQDYTRQKTYLIDGTFLYLHAPRSGFVWLDKRWFPYWLQFSFFPSDNQWPSIHASLLEFHNSLVNRAKQPETTWLDAPDFELHAEEQLLFLEHWLMSKGGATGYWNSLRRRIIMPVLEYHAILRSAAAACAAEAFRLQNGRWPRIWSDLVPAFLSAAPSDPFSKETLHWKNLEDGIIFYSVGQNLKDDGGAVHYSEAGWPHDVGFRLWTLDQRRLSPLTGSYP
jgi:hypothetical protein